MGMLGAGVAPILLFYGLQKTAASDAGLLLTLEMVATATLAHAFLHERFPRLELVGLGLLLAAGGAIALGSESQGTSSIAGVVLVLGAAVAWGIDNTVSARLVGAYPPAGLIGVK